MRRLLNKTESASNFLVQHKYSIVGFTLLFLFSVWLMFHTFSFNSDKSVMLIAAKLWSDFGAHIPLIRSFSHGSNWPPQYPVFPGEPIRYHFLFYLIVGILERSGIRIDWALNIPSILGFFGILVLLYLLAKEIFASRIIGFLTIIFFLFNGSLAFTQFFEKHPLSFNTLNDILAASEFPAFAPWDQREILAFWNLNIYTNQRHLGAAFLICLLFMYVLLLIERRKIRHTYLVSVLLGLLVGIFPFFHQPSLIIIAMIMGLYFLLFGRLRIPLIITGITAALVTFPQLMLLPKATDGISWHPGFYVHDNLTVVNFLTYWWKNMGVHLLLIPVGFLFVPWRAKKAFAPALLLFTISNLFQFSKELAASHKFFNFAFLTGQMLSAYVLVWYVKIMKEKYVLLRLFAMIHVVILIWLLTFSGIIDLFVIANDRRLELTDIPANTLATWFFENTQPDSVVLNSSYLYHPASLAGRFIFLGWPYFAWSAGYPATDRFNMLESLYRAENISAVCAEILRNNITYITFQNNPMEDLIGISEDFYSDHFPLVFSDTHEGWKVYELKDVCEAL